MNFLIVRTVAKILSILALDQIKQHIDSQISSLSQDIKDLRGLVASSSRISHPPPVLLQQPVAESTPPTARPTDKQFRTAARRLSQFIPEEAVWLNGLAEDQQLTVSDLRILLEYRNVYLCVCVSITSHFQVSSLLSSLMLLADTNL